VLILTESWCLLVQGNKFKRLKKAGRESEMDEHGLSDDDGTGQKRTGKDRLEYRLFGDAQGSCTRIDSHLPFSPIYPQIRSIYFCINCNSVSSDAAPIEEDFIEDDQPVDDNDVDDDDDEMADFIVEEDEIDVNGQVVRCGSLCSCLSQTGSMSICDCVCSPSK
jgi:transcription elongation factor SPT6